MPTAAKLLTAHTDLSDAAARILVDAAVAAAADSTQPPTRRSALSDGGAGGVPRLTGVDWAVSVATHSTSAAALGAVVTHVTLRTTDRDVSPAVVLTLPQLVALETAVREAAAALETA